MYKVIGLVLTMVGAACLIASVMPTEHCAKSEYDRDEIIRRRERARQADLDRIRCCRKVTRDRIRRCRRHTYLRCQPNPIRFVHVVEF